MKISLPLGVPASNSYQFMAFPLAIMSPHKNTEEWVFTNFIQTCLDLDLVKSPIPYYYYIYDYTVSPFLDVQKLKFDMLEIMRPNIIEFLEKAISLGYYVYMNVDEFFIPLRESTNKKHVSHDILISGFDTESKTLSAYGFTKRQKLEFVDVSFEMLESAHNSAKEIEKSLTQVILYKYVADSEYDFDCGCFKQQLEEYRFGVNSSMRYSALRTPWKRIYGLEAIRHLPGYIDNRIEASEKPDIRIFHFLYEYHALMKNRLKFMCANGFLKNSSALEKWDELLKSCEMVRNYALKLQHANKNGTHSLQEAKRRLKKIYDEEPSIIDEILESLLTC
jgi:hypothetical protein